MGQLVLLLAVFFCLCNSLFTRDASSTLEGQCLVSCSLSGPVTTRGEEKDTSAQEKNSPRHTCHYAFQNNGILWHLNVSSLTSDNLPKKSGPCQVTGVVRSTRTKRGNRSRDVVSVSKLTLQKKKAKKSASARIEGFDGVATLPLPATRTILIVIVNEPNYTNNATAEGVAYYWWQQQYGLSQWYGQVLRNQLTFNNSVIGPGYDIVTVNLTVNPTDPTEYVSLVASGLPAPYSASNYQHMALCVGLDAQLDNAVSGYGQGIIGCDANSNGTSCWSMGVDHSNINIWAHELGHNIGLQHSNSINATGDWVEYGDRSCMMGAAYLTGLQRKGFNPVQLFLLGLLTRSNGRVRAVAESSFSGALFHPYVDESFYGTSPPPVQLFQVNTLYFLAYRSPGHVGVDKQVDYAIPMLDPSLETYSGNVLVYRWESQDVVNGPSADQVTLIDAIPVNSTKYVPAIGYTVTAFWATNDYIMVGMNNTAGAPVAPFPKPVIPTSASHLLVPSITATFSNSTNQGINTTVVAMDYFGATSNINWLRFVLPVPGGATISSALLKIETNLNFSGFDATKWFQPSPILGDGILVAQIRAVATNNAPGFPLPLSMTFLATSVSSQISENTNSSYRPLAMRIAAEWVVDVTSMVQAIVSRPGWIGGNALLLAVNAVNSTDVDSFKMSTSQARIKNCGYHCEPVLDISFTSPTIPTTTTTTTTATVTSAPSGPIGPSGPTGATGAAGSSLIHGVCTPSPSADLCTAARASWTFYCDNTGALFSCNSCGSGQYCWVQTSALAISEPVSQAGWKALSAGTSITIEDVPPRCTVTQEGVVSLRGHVTLYPVPAFGGMLVAVLPLGSCPCSPSSNPVIVTTTALAAIPTGFDVCMVRLLISRDVRADVDGNGIIDTLDVTAIRSDKAYVPNTSSPSACVGPCGRADVNRDNSVNELDVISVTQSVPLPTNVSCGAVYATAFSCGSSRSIPLTPALGLSLDAIHYASADGTIVVKREARSEDKTMYEQRIEQLELRIQNSLMWNAALAAVVAVVVSCAIALLISARKK